MAFPSPPLTFTCRSCGWKKTVPAPVGDCRIPGFTHFSTCPNCKGEGTLEKRPANLLEIAAARLSQIARRR